MLRMYIQEQDGWRSRQGKSYIFKEYYDNGSSHRKTLPTGIFSRKYGMRAKRDPALTTPTHIHLPDGRQVELAPLVRQVTQRTNYNLRKTRKGVKIPDYAAGKRTAPLKYSIQERVWLAQAAIEDIAEEYAISLQRAQGIKYHSRYILEKLNIDGNIKE